MRPAVFLPRAAAGVSSGIAGSIEELLGEGVWLDSSEGVTPNGIFYPDMTDTVLPAMDLRLNDADYGWFYRYISQTAQGCQPQIQVEGNAHLQTYASIRPVPEMTDVYFVDLLFRPPTKEAFADTVVIRFDQVDGLNEARPFYSRGGLFESVRFYPHPVNGPVSVRVVLSRPAALTVEVYDALGRRLERRQTPVQARHDLRLSGPRASGVYLARLRAEQEVYHFKLLEVN